MAESPRAMREGAARRAVRTNLLKERLQEAGVVLGVGSAAYAALLRSLENAAEMGGVDVEEILKDHGKFEEWSGLTEGFPLWDRYAAGDVTAPARASLIRSLRDRGALPLTAGDHARAFNEMLDSITPKSALASKAARDTIRAISDVNLIDPQILFDIEEGVTSGDEVMRALDKNLRYLKPPEMPVTVWEQILGAKASQANRLAINPDYFLSAESRVPITLQVRASHDWQEALHRAEQLSPGGHSPRLARYAKEQQRLVGMADTPLPGPGGQMLPGEAEFVSYPGEEVRGMGEVPPFPTHAMRGTAIAEAWRRNVDPQFLKKLQFVHWTPNPFRVWNTIRDQGTNLLKDDLSASAYLREAKTGFSGPRFADAPNAVGFILEGDVNFLGNYDIYSGPLHEKVESQAKHGSPYHPTLQATPERGQRRWPSVEPSGESPTLPVLDEETFLTPAEKRGDYDMAKINEALIGNSRVVGIVVPQEEVRGAVEMRLLHEAPGGVPGLAEQAVIAAERIAKDLDVPLVNLKREPVPPRSEWIPQTTSIDRYAHDLLGVLSDHAFDEALPRKLLSTALGQARGGRPEFLVDILRNERLLTHEQAQEFRATFDRAPPRTLQKVFKDALDADPFSLRATSLYRPDYWFGEADAARMIDVVGDSEQILSEHVRLLTEDIHSAGNEADGIRQWRLQKRLAGFMDTVRLTDPDIELPAHPDPAYQIARRVEAAERILAHAANAVAVHAPKWVGYWPGWRDGIIKNLENHVLAVRASYASDNMGQGVRQYLVREHLTLPTPIANSLVSASEKFPLAQSLREYRGPAQGQWLRELTSTLAESPETRLTRRSPGEVTPRTTSSAIAPGASSSGLRRAATWVRQVEAEGAAERAVDAIRKHSPRMLRGPGVLEAALEGDRLMSAAYLAKGAGDIEAADALAGQALRKFRSLERLARLRGGLRTAGTAINVVALPFIALDGWHIGTQAREEGWGAVGRNVAEGMEQTGHFIGRSLLNMPTEVALGLREPGGEVRSGTLRRERQREDFLTRQSHEMAIHDLPTGFSTLRPRDQRQEYAAALERARPHAGRMYRQLQQPPVDIGVEELEAMAPPDAEPLTTLEEQVAAIPRTHPLQQPGASFRESVLAATPTPSVVPGQERLRQRRALENKE